MIFHLSNIDVREVSLVDHGAIDHDFTDHKAEQKARWFAGTLMKRINEKQISVDVLAEKSGIGSEELSAISTGAKSVTGGQLVKIADALGLKNDPTNEEAEMDKKAIEDLFAKLLSPITKALESVKGDVKNIVDARKTEADKAKADADAAKAQAEKDKKDKLPPADVKELTVRLTKAEETVKELGDKLEDAAKQIVARFEEIEKAFGKGRSQKINDEGDGNDKKTRWPSFEKLARTGGR